MWCDRLSLSRFCCAIAQIRKFIVVRKSAVTYNILLGMVVFTLLARRDYLKRKWRICTRALRSARKIKSYVRRKMRVWRIPREKKHHWKCIFCHCVKGKKRQKSVRWILEFFSFIFDLEFLIFGFSNCTFKLEFELIFCPNHFTAGSWLCYSNVVSTKIYCTKKAKEFSEKISS